MKSRKPPRYTLIFLAISSLVGATTPAFASDFRLGMSLGFGGVGLKKTITINSSPLTVQRSEGPGTVSLFVDTLLSERIGVALEHLRGFRLAPFSSGLSLTGLSGRWYFSPAPSVAGFSRTDTSYFVKRFAFFVGLGAGVTTGKVSREEDAITDVSASGVSLGFRGGADYPLFPGLTLRPELLYGTTFLGSETLNHFSVQCGVFFYL